MKNIVDEKISLYLDFIVKNITLGSLLATVKQIAQIRNRPEGVVRNEVSEERCPIPTFLDGGRRVATVFACAQWLAGQDDTMAAMVVDIEPAPKRRGRPHKAVRLAEGGAK